LADEGAQRIAFAERHFDAAGRHIDDFRRDDLTALEVGVSPWIGVDLLDAKRDALLLAIDVANLRLDHVALVEAGEGFFTLGIPGDVAQVDHAVQLRRKANEQTELGDVLDLAFDDRTDAVLGDKRIPRIGLHLLDAERDAALFA